MPQPCPVPQPCPNLASSNQRSLTRPCPKHAPPFPQTCLPQPCPNLTPTTLRKITKFPFLLITLPSAQPPEQLSGMGCITLKTRNTMSYHLTECDEIWQLCENDIHIRCKILEERKAETEEFSPQPYCKKTSVLHFNSK